MLTIRYRNKINLIKKFLLLWGGFGIGTMLAMVSLLYRLFIRIFDHSPNIQPCRVSSAMAKRSPWLPPPPLSIVRRVSYVFVYMGQWGTPNALPHSSSSSWTIYSMMLKRCVYDGKNKHNDKTAVHMLCEARNFFSDGTEYGTLSNGLTEELLPIIQRLYRKNWATNEQIIILATGAVVI